MARMIGAPQQNPAQPRYTEAKLSNLVTFEGTGFEADPSAPVVFWAGGSLPVDAVSSPGAIACPHPELTAALVVNSSGQNWGLLLQNQKPAEGLRTIVLTLGKTTGPETRISVVYEAKFSDMEVGASPMRGMLPGLNLWLTADGDGGFSVLGPVPETKSTASWVRIRKTPVTVKKPGGVALVFAFVATSGTVEIRNIKVISEAKTAP